MVRRPLSTAVPAGNLLGIHLFQCPVRPSLLFLPQFLPTSSPFPPLHLGPPPPPRLTAAELKRPGHRGHRRQAVRVHRVPRRQHPQRRRLRPRRQARLLLPQVLHPLLSVGFRGTCQNALLQLSKPCVASPVNSRTTQGSGRVTSCARISSTCHTALVRRGRPYECLILTPNTRSQSSLQSRYVDFASLPLVRFSSC